MPLINNIKELQGTSMSLSRILSGSSDRNIGTRSIKTQIKPNLGSLKVTSVLIASIALVACGGSSTITPTTTLTTTAPVASTGALTSIVGTWARCFVDGDNSSKLVATFADDGTTSVQKTTHSDNTTCDNNQPDIETDNTGTFTLGSAVGLDGSVDGIVTATQLSTSSLDIASPFDLIAIKDNKIFTGNTDGANNGSTLALQPTQLNADSLTKQIALTTADLVGIWKDCYADGGDSIEQTYTFTTSNADIVETEFTGSTDCSGGGAVAETLNTTYVLGNIVTVNGSIIGITNSTQITFTDTTDASNQLFDLVAIEGVVDRQLIFGDTDGDTQGDPDGGTEANRATQLFGQAFKKQ
jgi:hypothetical protein